MPRPRWTTVRQLLGTRRAGRARRFPVSCEPAPSQCLPFARQSLAWRIRAILIPRLERQLGDLAELPVVVGKLPLAPVVHHQQEIGPVLCRSQVTGVAEIVADIQRHPGTVHLARTSLPGGTDISSCNNAISSCRRPERNGCCWISARRCAMRWRRANGFILSAMVATGSSFGPRFKPPPRA